MQELHQHVLTARLEQPRIEELGQSIGRKLLDSSAQIREPDFRALAGSDLRLMFEEYDRLFLGGLCGEMTRRNGHSLSFRVSSRMTSAGGKAMRRATRPRFGQPKVEFEIAVSSLLLFQTFEDPASETPITVGGLVCRNRLEALQRVFEHELVHLLEFLLWERSSCSQDRFASIVFRLFGHTAANHRLITPRELARQKFAVAQGDLVSFESAEGRILTGRINRITRRATVLVQDRSGQLYSDGHRYLKYYVPLHQLRPAGG
ncbi:MAG: hypothetical protein KDA79_04900 [Planctomycetaceae bacterium]|nr:hypothetical protein [Planctomycetaceae bacterium]